MADLIRRSILRFLSTLPDHLDISVNGQQFHLVHGFPSEDPEARIWERPEAGSPTPIEGCIAIIGHTPTCYLTGSFEEQFKKENLRDNMSTLELVLNMLAEATTTEISRQRAPESFADNVKVAREGGEAAGEARKAVEARTGVPVVTPKNAAQLNQVVTQMIEGSIEIDDKSSE